MIINKKFSKPFSGKFLSEFVLTENMLPFTNKEIFEMDKELAKYEQLFMNPDVEKHLISRNELLVSFAISKAENSLLTIEEAQDVYNLVADDTEYGFIKEKIKNKKKLTRKDYEKLEFFNIAKTFRKFNQDTFDIKKLTPKLVKDIHLELTKGLDIFHKTLSDFDVYKSGKWRDGDDIRVGNYAPPSFKIIQASVKELVSWLKKDYSINNVAIFHTALYAVHPFRNGNKRVCRVLEHLLFRGLNINLKNLYNSSYYYHKQKSRYYKYLLYSLERKNLNHFTAFVSEALVLSMISVLKTSIEAKRKEFLEKKVNDTKIQSILRPLIKRHELQFKTLLKISKNKVSRQTFVTYLQQAHKKEWINRRKQGKVVYYSLNMKSPEEEVIEKWIKFAQERLTYIPDDILLT
ncbi:MAG: Fic family protein [Parcubacteria group bacterium]|nr:Fic family protein [Parcubacteria group bacterium]